MISQELLDLIKNFEGFVDMPYKDIGGRLTIGYGHLMKPNETFKLPLTTQAASAILETDLYTAIETVQAHVQVPLAPNQFSSCVSLCYNIGSLAFANSTLVRLLNKKMPDLAAKEFLKWDHVNGKVSMALFRRRQAEMKLFAS